MRWETKQKKAARRCCVHPALLWALWVPGADLGILKSKLNGAPQAALHTDFGLGIKHGMIDGSADMMVMEWDYFLVFYSTICLVLC